MSVIEDQKLMDDTRLSPNKALEGELSLLRKNSSNLIQEANKKSLRLKLNMSTDVYMKPSDSFDKISQLTKQYSVYIQDANDEATRDKLERQKTTEQFKIMKQMDKTNECAPARVLLKRRNSSQVNVNPNVGIQKHEVIPNILALDLPKVVHREMKISSFCNKPSVVNSDDDAFQFDTHENTQI